MSVMPVHGVGRVVGPGTGPRCIAKGCPTRPDGDRLLCDVHARALAGTYESTKPAEWHARAGGETEARREGHPGEQGTARPGDSMAASASLRAQTGQRHSGAAGTPWPAAPHPSPDERPEP